MASLTKKPNSQFWFACFRDASGKQCRRSTGETNIKKAQAIADQAEMIAQKKHRRGEARKMLSELYRKAYGEALPTASVRQYAEEWLAVKENETAPATYVAYQKSLAKFLTFLGLDAERDIADIRPQLIASFRNHILRQVSPQTVNFDLRSVRMCFKAARRDGYIIEDPAEFVGSVRLDKGTGRQAFTIPQIRAVLGVASDEWRSLIRFGIYTGQRLGDIASLTWENLDLEADQIRLVTRKTGKVMLLPIAGPLASHIATLDVSDDPKAPIHPRAFATLQREGGRTCSLSVQFGELLSQAGLRARDTSAGNGRNGRRNQNALSFHSLRHSAVSLLKDAGIPESVVMALVGHDSKAMSRHYSHVGQEALTKAAAALPEL